MTMNTRALVLIVWLAAPSLALALGAGAFLRELPPLEQLTEAHAVRAAAVFIGQRDQVDDLAACERRLREAGHLRWRDPYEPNRVLKKGFASLLFARALGLKGGWAARVAGMGPRLAYKELEFLDLVPPMGPRDIMTGSELFGLMRNAQDWARSRERQRAAAKKFHADRIARRGHGPDLPPSETLAPLPPKASNTGKETARR